MHPDAYWPMAPEMAPEDVLEAPLEPDLDAWTTSRISCNRGLARVDLSYSRTTNAWITAWAKWARTSLCRKLPHHFRLELDLSCNRISCEGAEALAWLLQQMSMECSTLKLYKNDVADRGAVALAAVIRNGTLRELHLSHNRIGAAGARALLQACAEKYPIAGAPLWLRLEANVIPGVDLDAWEANLLPLRRDKNCNMPFICQAPYGVGCNSSRCSQAKGHYAPVVHVPWIVRQRHDLPLSSSQTSMLALPSSRGSLRSGSRPRSRVRFQDEEEEGNITPPPPPPGRPRPRAPEPPAPEPPASLRTKEERLRIQIANDGSAQCIVLAAVQSPPEGWEDDGFLFASKGIEVEVLLVGSDENAEWVWAKNHVTDKSGWISLHNLELPEKRKSRDLWQPNQLLYRAMQQITEQVEV